MKLKITFKDPDGVYESIKAAADSSVGDTEGLSDGELEMLAENRRKELEEQCELWIEYGEYVTIEIDTESGTATVCKA